MATIYSPDFVEEIEDDIKILLEYGLGREVIEGYICAQKTLLIEDIKLWEVEPTDTPPLEVKDWLLANSKARLAGGNDFTEVKTLRA